MQCYPGTDKRTDSGDYITYLADEIKVQSKPVCDGGLAVTCVLAERLPAWASVQRPDLVG